MKTKPDFNLLTAALQVMVDYEFELKASSSQVMSDVNCVVNDMNRFISSLKLHINSFDNQYAKEKKLEVFKVLTEISFDKLEKDVMGVN